MSAVSDMSVMVKGDSIKLVQQEPFYIYGTGFVARRLYDGLIHRDGIENLVGFVVTELSENEKHELFGKQIQAIADIPRTSLILVAVHMIWETEVARTLHHLGFQRFVMTYDHLLEFQFGNPIVITKEISVSSHVHQLAKEDHDGYVLMAYLASIRKYMHGISGTDEYYLKYHEAIASSKAAQGRLQRFHSLLDAYETEGARKLLHYPICLDENGHVFDGMHRLTIAYAFHVPFFTANIYETHDYWGLGYEMGFCRRTHDEIFTSSQMHEMDAMREDLLQGE